MKKRSLLLVAMLVMVGVLPLLMLIAPALVVADYPSKEVTPVMKGSITGLGFVHGYLLYNGFLYAVSRELTPGKIAKISAADYSSYTIVQLPHIEGTYAEGINDVIVMDGYIWTVNASGYLFKLDPEDLHTVGYWQVFSANAQSLTHDGTYIFVCGYYGWVAKFNPLGETIVNNQISGISGYFHTIQEDGDYLYANAVSDKVIVKIKKSNLTENARVNHGHNCTDDSAQDNEFVYLGTEEYGDPGRVIRVKKSDLTWTENAYTGMGFSYGVFNVNYGGENRLVYLDSANNKLWIFSIPDLELIETVTLTELDSRAGINELADDGTYLHLTQWDFPTPIIKLFPFPPDPPTSLECENQISPQQVTTFTPNFSFRYTNSLGFNSSMFRIQVGTSAGDNSKWDNQQIENVENGATISTTYAGTALQRGVQYFWRVKIRDNTNIWSAWSSSESFMICLPNLPDNLRVENQISPQRLTTITPNFSFCYTDNLGENSSMTRVQVWGNGGGTISKSENIYPSEDAYTDSENPDTNYGSEDHLDVYYYYDGDTNYYKYAFLKFNLENIPAGATINSANMWWYVQSMPYMEGGVGSVEDNSWAENTITWNNQPSVESYLYGFSESLTDWNSFDLTGHVQEQVGEDGIVSIGFVPTYSEGGEGESMIIASRENPNYASYLKVSYTYDNYLWDNTQKQNVENNSIITATYAGENLQRGNTYFWRARVQDNTGAWSDWSDNENFRINQLPTAPTSLVLNSPIKVGETLTANASGSTDNDNDSITYYYAFYNRIDATMRQGWSTTNTYTIQLTNAHDNIIFFAKANDGYENSDNFENSAIVMNSIPTVENLKTEGQVNPTGLTTFTPTFSWNYSDDDNDNQSDYQIQVGTAENDNLMWDNTSAALTQITYSGNALARGVTYHVRVRAKDNYGWGTWVSGTFKLSQSPTVTVGNSTIELTLLEAGDTLVIPTSDFTIMLTIRTRSKNLLIYYTRIEEPPQIPAEGVVPFYFIINTSSPDAIADATITFSIPKSWVVANDIIPSTLIAWRNSDGTWQALSSRLASEDELYYYLEATTSGFPKVPLALSFGVSGQIRAVAPIENQPSPSQIPVSEQQTQVIFIVALGILIISVTLLVSTFKHHKRSK